MKRSHQNRFWIVPLAVLTWLSTGSTFAQYTISTLTNSGPAATFNGRGVAADTAGNVYATGTYPPGAFSAAFEVRPSASGAPQITPVAGADATVPTQWGYYCTSTFGATGADVDNPTGVAVDSSGNIYIAQGGGGPGVLRLYGGVLSAVPGSKNCDSSATGVAVDYVGNVYFSSGTDGGFVYKVTPSGTSTVAGGATMGCDNGLIGSPQGLAVDAAGNVYIADEYCNVIWKVPPAGTPAPFAGIPGNANAGCFSNQEGVPATSSNLDGPYGVAVDLDGNVFIADSSCGRIRMVKNGLIYTVAGPPTTAALSRPDSVAVGPGGKVYVGDQTRENILQLTPPGVQMISPPAGSVLPGTTVTFDWSGGSAGSQYELDVNDKLPLPAVGHGDIFGNDNVTTGNSQLVSDVPCDGRTIYVRLSTLINGQWQTGVYTYTADTCKMLHLSASPNVMAEAGGTLTLTAQVENFSTATETVQLNINGTLVLLR